MKKFWKKAIPVALSVAVAAGLAVNAGAAFEDYMDVKGHWAEATLHQAYDDGILKGYDAYNMAPDHSITTAQAVTVVCRFTKTSCMIQRPVTHTLGKEGALYCYVCQGGDLRGQHG